MGNRLTAISGIFLFLISCTPEADISENPAAYNDTIVSIFEPVQLSYNSLVEGIYSPEATGIEKVLSDFQSKAKKSEDLINQLPPFRGDTAYLETAKRLAAFYSKAATEDYPRVVDLVTRDSTTVEEAVFLEEYLMTSLEEEKLRFGDFVTRQEEFARKHDIVLVYPDNEKK